MRLIWGLVCVTLAGVAGAGCGKSSQASGSVNMVLNAVNSNQAAHASSHLLTKRGEVGTFSSSNNNMNAGSIFSGSPTSMIVNLVSIEGRDSTGKTTTFWTSSSNGGSPISLSSGTTDLTALGLNNICVPVGTYSGLVATFAGTASITGCVTGQYMAGSNPIANPAQTQTNVQNGGRTDSRYPTGTYTSDPCTGSSCVGSGNASNPAPVTYCTQSGFQEVGIPVFTDSSTHIGYNSDYITTPATATLIYLGMTQDNGGWSDTVKISNDVNFSVSEGATTTISVAMDLNRMLRFFSNTRQDMQPPNPGMKAGTSYFFTSIFESSVQFFAGTIGSVEGYEMTLTHSSGTYCNSSSVVYAWITLFKDASGNPTGMLIFPDDDDALTVAKGSGQNITGDPVNGLSFRGQVTPGVFSGFKSLASVGDSGTATMAIPATGSDGNTPQCGGDTFSVSYTRKL